MTRCITLYKLQLPEYNTPASSQSQLDFSPPMVIFMLLTCHASTSSQRGVNGPSVPVKSFSAILIDDPPPTKHSLLIFSGNKNRSGVMVEQSSNRIFSIKISKRLTSLCKEKKIPEKKKLFQELSNNSSVKLHL